MENIITEIKKNSIAEELGFGLGDILISINNKEIKNISDYEDSMKCEYIEVLIKKSNGETMIYEIEKYDDEVLGICF